MLDKDVERVIIQRLSTIKPPRSAFNKVMESVTSDADPRSTKRKNNMVLSPYQITPHIFMKKVLMIGTPVFALALVAIISAKSTIWPAPISESVVINDSAETTTIGSENAEVASDSNPSVSSNTESKTLTETKPVATASAAKVIDDVFVALIADVEADAASLVSEEDDVATISAELQNYNNIKNTNYEDLI